MHNNGLHSQNINTQRKHTNQIVVQIHMHKICTILVPGPVTRASEARHCANFSVIECTHKCLVVRRKQPYVPCGALWFTWLLWVRGVGNESQAVNMLEAYTVCGVIQRLTEHCVTAPCCASACLSPHVHVCTYKHWSVTASLKYSTEWCHAPKHTASNLCGKMSGCRVRLTN